MKKIDLFPGGIDGLILCGKEVKMPPSSITFKQAERHRDLPSGQDNLFES